VEPRASSSVEGEEGAMHSAREQPATQPTSASQPRVDRLPAELIVHVARCGKDARVLTAMPQVKRLWRDLLKTHSDALWKPVALSRFPRLASILLMPSESAPPPPFVVLFRRNMLADVQAAERGSVPTPAFDAYSLVYEVSLDGQVKAACTGAINRQARLWSALPGWYREQGYREWKDRFNLEVFVIRKSDGAVFKLYTTNHLTDRDMWETNLDQHKLLPGAPLVDLTPSNKWTASTDPEDEPGLMEMNAPSLHMCGDATLFAAEDDSCGRVEFEFVMTVGRYCRMPPLNEARIAEEITFEYDSSMDRAATAEEIRAYLAHNAPWVT